MDDNSEVIGIFDIHKYRCSTPVPQNGGDDDTFQQERRSHTAEFTFSEWKKGKPLTSSAKTLLANIYVKMSEENPTWSDVHILKKISYYTGVSTRSMQRMKTEWKTEGKFSTPGKERPAAKGKRSRTVIYDDCTLTAIRQKVHQFYMDREIPTVVKLCNVLRDDPDLPTLKRTAMTNMLHALNFKYHRVNKKSTLIDREDIVDWRRRYLRSIRLYQKENRNIVYVHETFVHAGITFSGNCHDQKVKSRREGASTWLHQPAGKGPRLIVVHAGGSAGFVPGALYLYKAKKETGDYRDEIDGPRFENWFSEKLLPALPQNTVIVMDNAKYHSVKKDPVPTMACLKEEIRAWLTQKGIPWDPNLIKRELIALAECLRPSCDDYIVDSLARDAGHVVLRLPPHHCELNPMEQVLAEIKNTVCHNNKTLKIKDVEDIVKEAFANFSVANWAPYCELVKYIEKDMWKLDGLMEDVIDDIIINVGTDTTTDEDEVSDAERNEAHENWLLSGGPCSSKDCMKVDME